MAHPNTATPLLDVLPRLQGAAAPVVDARWAAVEAAAPATAPAAAPAPTQPAKLASCGPWQASLVGQAGEFWQRLQGLNHRPASAFQSTAWLQDWFSTLGAQPGLQPVFVRAWSGTGEQDDVLLPLVRRQRGGYVELDAPDLGVSDYNAPLLRGGLQFTPESAAALWRGVGPLLAQCGDILRIDKMLPDTPASPNPLALSLRVHPCSTGGHDFSAARGWEPWRQSLSRQVRREGERHARVFARWPGAKFVRVDDPHHAALVFERLEQMQDAHLARAAGYVLNQPAYRALYERRLRGGLADGSVVLTCLQVGNEVVAALYALRHGPRCTVVRVAHGAQAWKAFAPGRLLIERSVQHLLQDGVQHIDLGVGDHAHKRHFGCQRRPLLQVAEPLTLRGHLVRRVWQLRAALRGLRPAQGSSERTVAGH